MKIKEEVMWLSQYVLFSSPLTTTTSSGVMILCLAPVSYNEWPLTLHVDPAATQQSKPLSFRCSTFGLLSGSEGAERPGDGVLPPRPREYKTHTRRHISSRMCAQLPQWAETAWQVQVAHSVSEKRDARSRRWPRRLPGGAPQRRGGNADRAQHRSGGPQRPLHHSERRERLSRRQGARGRRREEGGREVGAVHRRERGGGTRDTSEEQVEDRWFTLSLYPQGWREGSCWEWRRDNNGGERGREWIWRNTGSVGVREGAERAETCCYGVWVVRGGVGGVTLQSHSVNSKLSHCASLTVSFHCFIFVNHYATRKLCFSCTSCNSVITVQQIQCHDTHQLLLIYIFTHIYMQICICIYLL